MYIDELEQIQGIFNNAIESEKRVQKFIQDRLKEKCKISQDDIILIEEARKYKSAEEIVKNKFNIDEIFNASGRYPKAGIEFTRQLKQLVTDNEMSVIKGGKIYTATKQQVSDARKLLDAIINNDLELAEQVWRRYPTKKKMVTGHTSFTPNNYVYNELSSKAQGIVGELRKTQATPQPAVKKIPVDPLIEEARKYETVEQFKTATMPKEIRDEFHKKYGDLTLEEAKAKADEIFKYSRLLTKD